ncbi:MAG: helix-turn-helix transcriptional regulator [Anaerolineae bacterium]|nr:helix-turn-helix transcriptional regulator [Anaerolineae bacterium]
MKKRLENRVDVRIKENLRGIRKFMDGNLAAPITIDGLSRRAALSPYHFIRVFRWTYQQTPHQYLSQRRIEKAKELLRSSELPITEICSAVGFESLGSFSTLFRKQVGLSPRHYRNAASRISHAHAHSTYIPLCCCVMHGIPDGDL